MSGKTMDFSQRLPAGAILIEVNAMPPHIDFSDLQEHGKCGSQSLKTFGTSRNHTKAELIKYASK